MYFPTISFLIPTYNAATLLGRCLAAIRTLDYPQDRVQILVADGRSSDDTPYVAARFGATLLDNPARECERGKAVAFRSSRGEFIVLLDADNILASSDWLRRLLFPFCDPAVMGVESNYLVAPDFRSLDSYIAQLIIDDPLARMLAARPKVTIDPAGYLLKTYPAGSRPVVGANGFIWRRTVIEAFLTNRPDFNELDLAAAAASQHPLIVANVPGVGIYHYTCPSLAAYARKHNVRAKKHLARVGASGADWTAWQGRPKLIISALYLMSGIGPLCESVGNIVRGGRLPWLWHPIVSCLTVCIYASAKLQSLLTHGPPRDPQLADDYSGP